jgi:hypothetical protein
MRTLALAVALFAALPVFGAEPIQVQLDVTVISGPNSMLGQSDIKALLPKDLKLAGVVESADTSRLLQTTRDKCGAKLLAQPKLVTLSGRPAHFLSGAQVVVTGGEAVSFRNVGTELSLLPIVMAGSERIYLECNPVIRRVTPGGTLDERSLRTAVELKIGQSMIICLSDLPASKPEFGPPVLSKIPYVKNLNGARGESEALIYCVTPTIVAQRPAALPIVAQCPAALPIAVDHGKNVAAMLVREYQQACEANNSELAAKLARMALELDPMCFKTAPLPPATTEAPKKESRAFWQRLLWLKSHLGDDPNTRMEGLINQSEDLQQIRREWQRIWFEDQPSHLTPERQPMKSDETSKPKAERESFWRRCLSMKLACPWVGGMTLPCEYYLEHNPQYFRPDPDFPLEKELAAQQKRDRSATGADKNDYRMPDLMPALVKSVPRCKDEPSEQEIRAALRRSQNVTVNCDDAEFINELLVDRLDSPQFFPLVGKAQLQHCHWKCTVYYTESVGMKWPLKIGFKTHRVVVIYIDKDRLEVSKGDCQKSHHESVDAETLLLVDGQWRQLKLFDGLAEINPRVLTLFDDRIPLRFEF